MRRWIVVASLLAGCLPPSAPVEPPTPAPAAKPRAARDIVADLKRVADRTDEENAFIGAGPARAARQALAELPAEASPTRRVDGLLRAAYEELRLGDAAAAIARLDEARRIVAAPDSKVDRDRTAEVLYRLGVANLRVGENENCCAAPNSESCILPIRGGGVHSKTVGSSRAMECFRDVLRLVPERTSYAYRARWLLNLAAMTLGRWPDALTAAELIPRSAFDSGFDSGVEFPRFENVAAQIGAETFHLSGGLVVDDLDGDGFFDILTSSSDPGVPLTFLHNDGRGRFEDRTKGSGLEGELGGLNMVDADYDNDGDLDVYVLRGGWFRGAAGRVVNSLLRNDGRGHFTDVTYEAGVGEKAFPTSTAAWGDYDGDGRLDLYVGSETTDETYEPNQLFHNDGDGRFTDVAKRAGVEDWRFTKSVVWGDYDGDDRPDLYVAHQGTPGRLYRNNGNGTFTDAAPSLGLTRPTFSFGAFFFDYDDDGALDLYVSAFRGATGELGNVAASALGERLDPAADSQRLWRGDGRGGFTDVTAAAGLDRVLAPMGHNFGDVNDDGRLDVYLGTGYPDYEALMPKVMYLNRDGRRFADVAWAGGFGHLQKGHAVAFADMDGDGDTDVVESMGGAFPGDGYYTAVYRNPGFGNSWLSVEVVGRRTNRCGIGVRIRADVVEGGKRRSIYRHVNTGGTFGCNPLRQHLGLGKATKVERLEVRWPTTGRVQTWTDVPADRSIRVVEDAADYETLKR